MSAVNQKYIEELKEFEYFARDGGCFTSEQKQEIISVCRAIITTAEE